MKNLITILALCLALGIGYYFYMGNLDSQIGVVADGSSQEKPLKTTADFRTKLTEINMNRAKLVRAIEKLEKRKNETVTFLKEKGIRKVADAQGDPKAEMELQNLKGWTESIKKHNLELAKYDETIPRIEAMLQKLERDFIKDQAGLTEEQQVELKALVLDLDDRLGINDNDPLADAELDALLGVELGNDSSDEDAPDDDSTNKDSSEEN
jgi:hypothetical protein